MKKEPTMEDLHKIMTQFIKDNSPEDYSTMTVEQKAYFKEGIELFNRVKEAHAQMEKEAAETRDVFAEIGALSDSVLNYYDVVNSSPEPMDLALATCQLGEQMQELSMLLIAGGLQMATDTQKMQASNDDNIH